jgi:hypothetical protein
MADMPVFRISRHRMPRLKRLGAFPVITLSSASISARILEKSITFQFEW